MKIFFTSDQHFGHANIIKHCARSDTDINAMNERLLLSWNSTVGPKDIVHHLGDLFWSQKTAEALLPRLNGILKIIQGNHDGWKPRIHIIEILPLIYELKHKGLRLVLSRYPLPGTTDIPGTYMATHTVTMWNLWVFWMYGWMYIQSLLRWSK